MSLRHAIIVIDLAFGDCGKGTIVDFLARRHAAHTVVRFNGGPQAGHNVFTPDGRHHTFSQFGSATFLPGVRTLLTRFMLIEPYALLREAAHLAELKVTDALDRLLIDERCPIITPAHQAANRLRELARGGAAHGTCGVGFGETVQDSFVRPEVLLYVRDLNDPALVARTLLSLCDLKAQQLSDAIAQLKSNEHAQPAINTLTDRSWIDAAVENYGAVARCARIVGSSAIGAALAGPGTTIYEGAQGVLLDQDFGFHPHTTWSRTTCANADEILREIGFAGQTTRIGLLRTYFTRHGAGPMVTEDAALRPLLPEAHNTDDGWQGPVRTGVFDAVAARYALRVAGALDGLAMTHLDRLGSLPPHICTSYLCNGKSTDIPLSRAADASDSLTRMLRQCAPIYAPAGTTDQERWLEVVQQLLGRSVWIRSAGVTANDKIVSADSPCGLRTLPS